MNSDTLENLIKQAKKELIEVNNQIETQNIITQFLLGIIILALLLLGIKTFIKYKIKNKFMQKIYTLKEKLSSLENIERNIITVVIGLLLALIAGYFFSETLYYSTNSQFANGTRISEQEYNQITEDGDYSSVITKFNFNYLVFYSAFIIFSGLFYLLLKNNLRADKSTNLLDQAQKMAIPLVVNGYRKVANEKGCAPTEKTTDREIIEVYKQVLTAFNFASHKKNENIPTGKLNFIALKFFQVYEMMEKEAFNNHLEYEVDKYLSEGLRPEYNQTLEVF